MIPFQIAYFEHLLRDALRITVKPIPPAVIFTYVFEVLSY